MKIQNIQFIITILLLCFLPVICSAQTISLEDVVSVTITPEYPGPFTETVISVESFNTDLDRTTITWIQNGTVVSKRIGQTAFTFTTGALGNRDTIQMRAQTTEGSVINKTITIVPSRVILLDESTGYISPFYKGKNKYALDGTVRIHAIPEIYENGKLVDPRSLMYVWEIQHTKIPNISGFGKNTIILGSDITYRTKAVITVTVSTLDGAINGRGGLALHPRTPLIRIYKNDPLIGINFNEAVIGDNTLTEQELNLEIFPYFFDIQSRLSPNITYSWSMNGTVLDTQTPQYSLTVRNDSNTEGRSRIDVSATHAQHFIQESNDRLYILYGNKNSQFSF